MYEGAIIAALLARPGTQARRPWFTTPVTALKDRLFTWRSMQSGRLALALATVQGDLEEAPEVAECLLAFLFHYLLADDRITSLSQGAPQMTASPHMTASAPPFALGCTLLPRQ